MTLVFRRNVVCLTLVGLVAACAHAPKVGGDPQILIAESGVLPTPATRAPSLDTDDFVYPLGPFDKLTLDVFGMPELSIKEMLVDPNGSISIPLAGSISVKGKTVAQVEGEVRDLLRENYIREPKVSINLIESVSNSITVDGQVRKPGIFPVAKGLTLMSAVALAQGTTNDARLDEVVVFRTVDGQRYAALYNLGAIRSGNYVDPAIYAGDLVMVGDADSKRLFKDLLTALPAILTPIVILLTQN